MPKDQDMEHEEMKDEESRDPERETADAGNAASPSVEKKDIILWPWMILPTITWMAFVGLATVLFRPFMSLDPALCLGFVVGSAVFAFALMASGSIGTTVELNITCAGLLVLCLILYSVIGRAREVIEQKAKRAAAVSATKQSQQRMPILPDVTPAPSNSPAK